MTKLPTILAAVILGFAQAKTQAADGPTFPGNEALRIVNGKRVVELPPMSKHTANLRKKFGPTKPPGEGTILVYMTEGPDGLLECSERTNILSECRPSTLGTVRTMRYWVVKRSNSWLLCLSRKPNARCSPLDELYPDPALVE